MAVVLMRLHLALVRLHLALVRLDLEREMAVVRHGLTLDSAARHGAVLPRAARHGAARHGAARHSAARHSAARPARRRRRRLRMCSVRRSVARLGWARLRAGAHHGALDVRLILAVERFESCGHGVCRLPHRGGEQPRAVCRRGFPRRSRAVSLVLVLLIRTDAEQHDWRGGAGRWRAL